MYSTVDQCLIQCLPGTHSTSECLQKNRSQIFLMLKVYANGQINYRENELIRIQVQGFESEIILS